MKAIEFILQAINHQKAVNASKGKEYKGLHVVYSGLNDALVTVFGKPGMDKDERRAFLVGIMDEAVKSGKIVKQYAFGGPMLYIKGEEPVRAERITTMADAFAKFGMTPPPVIAPKTTAKSAAKTAA